jgi:transposase InsO family protein
MPPASLTPDEGAHAMTVADTHPWIPLACRSRRAAAQACQAPRRAAESRVRWQAAALCEDLCGHGYRHGEVAQRLCVPSRTLGHWRQACRRQAACQPRGRPCHESPLPLRLAVLAWLEREGTHMGLPTLRAAFPGMPRGELRELQSMWRQHYQATHRHSVETLTWHQPGRVWAMDHKQLSVAVKEIFPAVLCVRDLASGMQLAWQPVADETARTTAVVLQSLMEEHGPPLVLKSDNGSAFKGRELAELLAARRVVWLPSPPRMARYNGSCEATIGHLQTRTAHFAQREASDVWTRSSLEAARRQANELGRPEGHLGPTPSQRWAARTPITEAERDQLAMAIGKHREKILAVTSDFHPDNLNHKHRVCRQAVRRALLDLGLLTITRRSISLPFKLKKRAKIS